MARNTGRYRITRTMGEDVRAFVPDPLPPANPPLAMHGPALELHAGALAALSRLAVAGMMVPSTDWFLYGFVRKEAVLTSQIEGVQATLPDVVTFDATDRTERAKWRMLAAGPSPIACQRPAGCVPRSQRNGNRGSA